MYQLVLEDDVGVILMQEDLDGVEGSSMMEHSFGGDNSNTFLSKDLLKLMVS